MVLISAPVLLFDEVLKWVSRNYLKPRKVDTEHATYDKKKDE